MKAVAVIGLEKNNVWDFYKKLENYRKKYGLEFIPFIYSDKDKAVYDNYESLEYKGYKPEDFCAALSVGGDGTFLYTSRVFAGTEVPIFGINKGHLGFNTSIEENEFDPYFQNFMEGKSGFEYKVFLSVKVQGESSEHIVLNDGVISYSGISRTIRLKIFIGDVSVCDFRGDGLIISSPTGSTAYNLSAGGPILHPSVNAFVLCPICPLTLAIRPYIVPFEEIINIKIEQSTRSPQLTLDGQKIIILETGQTVTFKKSDKTVKIIKSKRTFSEILEKKLGWKV
jgi:NAD+ kinase